MVTGMFGCMYMSGKISNADKYNTELMKEGTELYKSVRENISKSYPIYPAGLHKMAYDGYLTLGLLDESERKIMLGVWKKNTEYRCVDVDMSPYADKIAVERVYPNKFDGLEYSVEGTNIKINFPDGNSAIYFVIKY